MASDAGQWQIGESRRPAKTSLSLLGGWVKIMESIRGGRLSDRAVANAFTADVRHRR
jgi:hypothetical protein